MSRIATVCSRSNGKNYPSEYRTCDSSGKTIRPARTWYCMMWRVSSRSTDRKNYFDKGVVVCEEWKYWPNFCDWAKMNGYTDDLELDRIDYNGNYEPSNCRFVDLIVQANNKDKVAAGRSISKARRAFESRPFVCVETGQMFNTQIEAQEQTGVRRENICIVLNGKGRTAGGYHWRRVVA